MNHTFVHFLFHYLNNIVFFTCEQVSFFFTNFTLSVPDIRYLHSLQNSYSLYDDIFQFRPIGDYGVAVVHKSKLNYDDKKK